MLETEYPPPPPPCLLYLISPPPPSNSLSMPHHDEGALRDSLLDLTHKGKTVTDAQGATEQTGKALPSKSDGLETYTALEMCE